MITFKRITGIEHHFDGVMVYTYCELLDRDAKGYKTETHFIPRRLWSETPDLMPGDLIAVLYDVAGNAVKVLEYDFEEKGM